MVFWQFLSPHSATTTTSTCQIAENIVARCFMIGHPAPFCWCCYLAPRHHHVIYSAIQGGIDDDGKITIALNQEVL